MRKDKNNGSTGGNPPVRLVQAGAAAPPGAGGADPLAPPEGARLNLAVATRDGLRLNAHLGEARSLRIYRPGPFGPVFLEERPTPPPGAGRWAALAATLQDCTALLVNGVGGSPQRTLEAGGLRVLVLEGAITVALGTLFAGGEPGPLEHHRPFKCGESCAGPGGGCGA